jgi:Cu/Ag efflux protein CusF
MKMKTLLFLLGLAGLCWSARPARAAKLYHGRGVVVEIKDSGRVLVIRHDAIPGLMEAMTMPFELADAGLAKGVQVGDSIRFTLRHKGNFWPIIALKKVRAAKAATTTGAPKVEARPTATMAPMNMPM